MRTRIDTFKENAVLGGFSLAIRDDWSYKIKRVHISAIEKEAYQKEFGDRILLEREFLSWWLNLRQAGTDRETEPFVK